MTSRARLASGDILVVDDNQRNLVAIEAALGPLARRMVTAKSGRGALRILLTGEPAVILLDVQMPSMDGYATARLIRSRERTRHIPIIFVTAYDRDDREIAAAYQLGAVDFLFKPIVAEILRAKVSVFVTLQDRTAEVARQAELLREHEAREHTRRLEEERRRWEAAALRERMEEERRSAEAMSRKATELAETIADKERAERELVRINEHLAEADRRKDEFLAVLSHELRNPLSAVVAGLELLERRDLGDPVAVRTTRAMARQARHLGRLVDDLLDVSRITSGKIELQTEPLDLASVVRRVADGERSPRGLGRRRLTVDIADGLALPIRGDPVRLNQIIGNLLDNAIRYTNANGTIRIRCSAEGGEAILEITDDGCGLTAEDLPRIFDRFFQHSPGNDGLGLGLPLVRQLTELHGGRVEASSPGPNAGSTFAVRLPLVDEAEAPPPAIATPRPTDSAPRRRNIVVIEDNDDTRDLLCQLLENHGFTVHAAADGAAGLELLIAVQPDVALVDIHLPSLDGYNIAKGVRARFNGCGPRLVAMTGFGQRSDREQALAAGFDDHLVKPTKFDKILEAVQG